MWKYLWLSLALGMATPTMAEEIQPVREDGPVVVYQSEDDFQTTLDNLKMAVTNQGLLVSGELHLSEMLNRTGPDLGFPEPVFSEAESVEFCSALMSHKMIQASPLNAAICPFTIAVYRKTAEPDTVYLAYRKPELVGDQDGKTRAEVMNMLNTISREAVGGGW